MIKTLSCSLLLLLTCETLYAQVSLRLPWAKRLPRTTFASKASLADINISYQLDRRLDQTFKRAVQAQQQLPINYNFFVGDPINETFKESKLNPQELYPEQTFLKTPEQTGKYLASRSNRLILPEIHRMKRIWAQIDQNLDRLHQEAAHTPQPQDPVTWLAQTIPSTTQQLFIGETHLYEKIRNFVMDLLPQLRAQFPQREIILFTEFLPENFKWTQESSRNTQFPELLHKYFPIWDAALKAQIQTIGLELPDAVDGPCEIRFLNEKGFFTVNTIWASLEGMRLRNERWKKTLTAYRAQHPDALFVIYTGADHSLYSSPFTLATPHPQTFVVALYPDKEMDWQFLSPFSSRMVASSKPTALKALGTRCEVVKWESPDLATITGFNVRIKWPTK